MPLLNDMARCMGYLNVNNDPLLCDKRETCARYLECKQGGPNTRIYAHICFFEPHMYIPAEKPNVQDAIPG